MDTKLSPNQEFLSEIHIRSLVGIDKPFSIIDIQPGLNVVLGPNGIGKTSICRALNSLLFSNSKLKETSVRAVWQSGASKIEAARNAGKTSWVRDAAAVNIPLLPEYLTNCFILKMEDLLPATGGKDPLADQVERELDGGFDINSVQSRFLGERCTGKLLELAAARKVANEVSATVALTQQMEGGLSDLKRRLEAARSEVKLKPYLRSAEQYMRATKTKESTALLLESMPSGMDLIKQSDSVALDDLNRELEDARLRSDNSAIGLEAARKSYAACLSTSGETPLSSQTLEALERHVVAMRDAEHSMRVANEQRDLALADARTADAALFGVELPDSQPPFPVAILQQAATLVNDKSKLSYRRNAYRQTLADLASASPSDPPPAGAELEDARRLLSEWLASVPTQQLPKANQGSILVTILIAIAAILELIDAILTKSFIAGLAVVAAIVAGVLLNRKSTSPVENVADKVKDRYLAFNVPPPTEWSSAAVEAKISQINHSIVQRDLHRALTDVHNRMQGQLQVCESEGVGNTEAIAEFNRQNAMEIEKLSASSLYLLQVASRKFEADVALEVATTKVSNSSRDLNEELAKFVEQIDVRLVSNCVDANSCQAALHEVKRKQQELDKLKEAEKLAETEWQNARDDSARRQKALDDFFVRLNISSGSELDMRLELLDTYKEANSELHSANNVIRQMEAELSKYPELMAMSEEEILLRIAAADTAEAMAENLNKEITTIELQVGREKSQQLAEKAQSDLETQKEKAEQLRQQTLQAVAGVFLLEKTSRGTQSNSPGVIARADELFRTFTNNAYRLIPRQKDIESKTGTRLCAVHQDSGSQQELDELSGGTRVQLLMAVRIAFAESAETSIAAPIFIDEALANSDPERFNAAAKCFHTLAESGRQIFYLTSQPEDIARLSRNTGSSKVNVIDMVKVRGFGQSGLTIASDTKLTALATVPEPGAMTELEYAAAIRVPAFAPGDHVQSCHLWYLQFDNLTGLYRVLSCGYKTVGRVRDLNMVALQAVGLSSSEIETLHQRFDIVERFVEATFKGVGARITRDDLLKHGVSQTFIDRACDAAEAVGWMANESVKRISSISGFLTKSAQNLRENLALANLLCDEESVPLTLDQTIAFVLNRISGVDASVTVKIVTLLWSSRI